MTAHDLSEVSGFADIFIVAIARSELHGRTLKDTAMDTLDEMGFSYRIEGETSTKWTLLDAGDLIVNILSREGTRLLPPRLALGRRSDRKILRRGRIIMDCIFCKLKDYVLENELAYAVFDVMPVNPGHLLIIPKRHVQNYFDITPEEELAMHDLLHKGKKLIDEKYSPDGYNFGVNCTSAPARPSCTSTCTSSRAIKATLSSYTGGVRGVIPREDVRPRKITQRYQNYKTL